MTFLWNFYLAIVLISMLLGCFRIVLKLIDMFTNGYAETIDFIAPIFMLFVFMAFPLYLMDTGEFFKIFTRAWPF